MAERTSVRRDMPYLTVSLRPAEGERYRASGDWDDRLLGSYLDEARAGNPSRLAVVDGETRLTYGELDELVRRVATALEALSVMSGDVVAWQLPNWWEALVLHHAIVRLGAVSNPLMPILRERELGSILQRSGARVLVVPELFRGFDFVGMANRLAAESNNLQDVVVVRPNGSHKRTFTDLLQFEAAGRSAEGSPDDPVLLLYTSGTESLPKGVLHSHNTLGYENRSLIDLYALTDRDVVFMPSPVGHITGVLYGLHLPVVLGTAVVFQDVWDAGRALELIELERCSFQVGATPFLHAMTHHPDLVDHDLTSLRVFACGGADVSPQLVRQATQRLGCTVVRVYGSTEFPTVSGGVPSDSVDLRAETDGRIIGRAEVQVRSTDCSAVPAGQTGELHVRGPERFLGYQDRDASERAIDQDGWFRTGDLGAVDADGYLTIQGREKDIIIRGGENISCKEVEDLLLEHEGVEDVAVVGMPDCVMVERVCAYVVPHGGSAPPTADLVGFLKDAKIARQKIPERFEFVSELPRTPSGKIKKFELRAHIASIIKGEREAE